MKVYHPKPSERVAAYITDVLVLEMPRLNGPFIMPLFANGMPTLLFHTTRGQINTSSNFLTLFGQTVIPETLTLKDGFTLIAYFFRPYTLSTLFGIEANELTDKPVDLNLLNPSVTVELQEQLLNASSTKDMLLLIDNYIYGLVTASKTKACSALLKYATEKICINPDAGVLMETQKDLCMTERTFQRLFVNHIGISPNQYRRVAQFNAAFQKLQKRQFSQLSDIAYEHGYADQSHYIRAFKEFTNLTPKQFLNYGSAD